MSEPTMVAVDGRDALAYVIVRPGANGRFVIDAAAKGLDKRSAAYVLRHVADQWDPPAVLLDGVE